MLTAQDVIDRLNAVRRANLNWTSAAEAVEEELKKIEAELTATPPVQPLTAERLADALDCFWNAAIGHAHNAQSTLAMDTAGSMAEGFAAVANRLREG